jgi:hypothetical protein
VDLLQTMTIIQIESTTLMQIILRTLLKNCVLYVVAMDYQSLPILQFSAVLAKTNVCLANSI